MFFHLHGTGWYLSTEVTVVFVEGTGYLEVTLFDDHNEIGGHSFIKDRLIHLIPHTLHVQLCVLYRPITQTFHERNLPQKQHHLINSFLLGPVQHRPIVVLSHHSEHAILRAGDGSGPRVGPFRVVWVICECQLSETFAIAAGTY